MPSITSSIKDFQQSLKVGAWRRLYLTHSLVKTRNRILSESGSTPKICWKVRNRNKKAKKDGSNCRRFGEGSFGVVYRQILEKIGHGHAVKEIAKKVPQKLNYSREFPAMVISAKVCVPTPNLRDLPLLTTPTRYSSSGPTPRCFDVRHCFWSP